MISLAALSLTVLLPLFSWPALPDSVPVHFGASGAPDAWGPKGWVLLVPAVSALIYSGLGALVRRPHLYNYPWPLTEENKARQQALAQQLLRFLRAEILTVFAYIEWGMVQIALGRSPGLHQGFLALFLVVVFGTIAGYFVASARA